MQRPTLSRWRRLTPLLLPPLVVVAFALLLHDAIQRRRHSAELVRQTQGTVALLNQLQVRLVDAEAGQRGFLVAADEDELQPYLGAARDVWSSFASLRGAMGADDPRLTELGSLLDLRLALLETGITIRRTAGFEAARDFVATGQGREVSVEVRGMLDSLRTEQARVLAERDAQEERRARGVLWILFGGAGLVIGVALLTDRLLSGYAGELERMNDELEQRNRDVTDQAMELELQAEELQSQSAHLQETLSELEAANEELMIQRTHLEEVSAELEASNDELLTANAALQDRTAEAVEANQAKSDFLATMSHELRTPLNAIAGYTDLIALGIHGPVSEAQQKALGRIQRNHEYLLSLINDVLNFAKLEAGRLEVRVADLPVAQVLAGVEDVISPLVRAKELHYACDPCEPGLRLRGDRDRIDQVLINLVTNAIKFTEAKGHVQVHCDADEERVRIHVTDTGRGIPAEKLEAIFDPFVQVGRECSGKQQGVGLGLAISRELAQAMQGDLTVRSEEGKGSTFTLSLLRGRRVVPGSIFSPGAGDAAAPAAEWSDSPPAAAADAG
ncbi:MAG TPA: ATP-binding protein [Longimicrobiaceae bacterium]|nr:ATP-binding protein [Longimicrobiaceae bacterium]